MSDFIEAVENIIESKLEGLHTAIPARFESYDAAKRRANVLPLLKRVYADGSVEALPVLANVPVQFPCSSTAGVTFPINKGDGCLLIFTERSIDEWSIRGGLVEPKDPRKFDLSDAIAIAGLFGSAEAGVKGDNENATLQNGAFKVSLSKSGKVRILGAGNVDIVALLNDWLALLLQAKVITGIGLQPFDPTTLAQMQSLKNKINLMVGP